MHETRICPDGNQIAIRTDFPLDHPQAWGVMHSQNGGHWATNDEVERWTLRPDLYAPEGRSSPVS